MRCSERMTSTVLLKGGGDPLTGVIENIPKGESDRGDDLLHRLGVPPRNGVKAPLGVVDPGVSGQLRDGLSACEAACSNKFVVPKALVVPERAEHTMATLWWSK